jgi:hypothetical protein
MNKMLHTDAGTAAGNNLESIDRAISSGDEEFDKYNPGDCDIYGFDRSADTFFDAYVNHGNTTPIAQVDTSTIGGTFEADDVFTVIIDGTSVAHTVVAGDTNNEGILDALVLAINADGVAGLVVTALKTAATTMTLTAITTGEAVVITSTAVNGGATDDQTLVTAITTSPSAVTNRFLTEEMMKAAVSGVEEASGETPNLIITGTDAADKIDSLFKTNTRYMTVSRNAIVVGDDGVSTAAGNDVGLQVAAYNGIPILRDTDVVKDGMSRIYFINTEYMYIGVRAPTLYKETENVFQAGAMQRTGLFYFAGELICTNPKAQGKIVDLKIGTEA